MDTNEGVVAAGRRRRRHSKEFKAEAVRACAHPGVSMAAVALRIGINANLLRRWVVDHAGSRGAVCSLASSPPEFIPVALPAATRQSAEAGPIHVELKRGAMTVNVHWPVSGAADCATWLRELLR